MQKTLNREEEQKDSEYKKMLDKTKTLNIISTRSSFLVFISGNKYGFENKDGDDLWLEL